MNTSTKTKTSNFVPRVNQLDAIHLNNEITRSIRDSIIENLQEIAPILFNKIQPEIDLLIQSGIWFGSVHKQFSTFGQQVLQISYPSDKLTKSRLCLHFLLSILPKYLTQNTEHRLNDYEILRKIINYGNNIALILTVINFLRFLKSGKKPSLIDFLLGLDYISLDSGQQRNIGYDYMTRELVWGGFMELFGIVLPLINFQKLKRIWKTQFGNKYSTKIDEPIKPVLLLSTKCCYCGERPSLPHHIGCGHIFCFYCIQANVQTDSNFMCPVCDSSVHKVMQVIC